MNHSFSPRRRATAALIASGLLPWGIRAQTSATAFPTKPIHVLIGVPAGGTQDVLTRAIGEYVRPTLGPLVLDNRGGAAGRIAIEVAKNAEPDGHTIMLGTAGTMTMFPNAYKSLNYDPFKDFAPIVNAASFELALTVHKDVPANTLAEFITWAKSQGNKVSFASYGAGTPSHFLGEMLNRSAGLQMLHIPYRGSTPARQDILGGTVPVFFDTVGGAITSLQTGRVKVLATSGSKRSPPMPAIPTFAEQGYPDVVANSWFSFYAPAKTPQPVLDKLRAEFTKAVNSREVRQQLLVNGMYPVGDGPEALLKTMREDTARWGRIMRAVNFVTTD
ncbi:tripartite tricarboxylate transporter substrate binding protein [Caenimonas koreensis DSM 17982]|uniref:Tripartite tricarboxylate transporter substrate binding protein n=1 Tax=Caenimonas koreensis DSM 17982 TaxID=1121255 RepID=A0A844AYW5_9BURK|nr:tripartite tricarboxylate transporter substrate binding protein [Caenimonas koreensis]MRD46252.1 tripartite tricarboxylate transporter substrate binding protein [Caenimonas koreensis DSM 17982]